MASVECSTWNIPEPALKTRLSPPRTEVIRGPLGTASSVDGLWRIPYRERAPSWRVGQGEGPWH